MGVLLLAMGLFFVSFSYSIKGNKKWLLYMSLALTMLGTVSVFIELTTPYLSLGNALNLLVAGSIFFGLAILFGLAYRMQNNNEN